MKSVCVELKTKCHYCGNPLIVNALVNDVYCKTCNNINKVSTDDWHSLLEDSVKEGPSLDENEGQTSTVFMGQYQFSLMYGNQKPRCEKCKTSVPEEAIRTFSEPGIYKCTKCSNDVSIRPAPDIIKKKFPSVTYLVAEDEDMLSKGESNYKPPQDIKPVLFTCPSCAGNLKVDGSDRMIVCEFCDSRIYLPDDLWYRLHPPKVIERWYLCFNEKAMQERIPYWYDLCDVTMDSKGNLYVASEDDDDVFMVWSMGPDFKARWIRKDLNYEPDDTGISITNDGNLYLWDKNKHSLLKLSSADGSTLDKIKGKKKTADNPYPFNLQGCDELVSDTDGTILALINDKIVRFNPDGSRASLWREAPQDPQDKEEDESSGGFLSGITNIFKKDDTKIDTSESSSTGTQDVEELGDMPENIDSSYARINIGWDGYLYMLGESSNTGELAKYDRNGKKLFSVLVPLKRKECKPCTDSKGNIYIVGEKDSDITNLVRYSPGTGTFETVLTDLLEGGVLESEDTLAVAPDGTIYLLNYYNRLKVFAPDGTLKFITDRSREDDKEKLDEAKKKKDNDESF